MDLDDLARDLERSIAALDENRAGGKRLDPMQPPELPAGPLTWDGVEWTRRPVDPSHTVDLFGRPLPVHHIDVGWWVTSRTLVDADGYLRGGLVVDSMATPDPDTGEIVERWVCVTHVGRGGDVARVVIDHPDDVDHARRARQAEIRDLAKLCHRIVGRSKARSLRGHEEWVAQVAHRLDGLVLLGGAA